MHYQLNTTQVQKIDCKSEKLNQNFQDGGLTYIFWVPVPVNNGLQCRAPMIRQVLLSLFHMFLC